MKNRVLYFRKWADFLLSHVRLVLVCIFIVVFLAAFFSVGSSVVYFIEVKTNVASISLNDLLKTTFSTVVATIIASLITFAAQRVLMKRKRSLEGKRKLYSFCETAFETAQNIWAKRFILCIIQLFYGHRRRIFSSQNAATKDLVHYVSEVREGRKKIIWIAGPPFSGKTTAVLDFIMQLAIRDDCRTLFQQLDRKIHYYDIAHDREQLTQVLKKLRYNFYRNKLLIVDNAYKVSPETFLEFIYEVKLENTFATIVLTRRPEDFLSQDGQIEALSEAMKASAYRIDLGELPVQGTLENGGANEVADRYGVRWQADNSKVVFHLANLVYLNEAEYLLSSFAEFLKGDLTNRDYIILFVSVMAACLFTGSASFNSLAKACPDQSIEKKCRLLAKIGFLGVSPDEKHKRVILHESLAQYYVKRTYAIYRKEYLRIFEALQRCKLDTSATYLYSRFLSEDPANRTHDVLFLSINYRTLLSGLLFVAELEPLSQNLYSREFGILYDRVGELSNALHSYEKYYLSTPCADALLKKIQVDHTIYEANRREVNLFAQSKDAYSRLLARYWQLHMEMHKGIFSYEDFSDIMKDCSIHADEIIDKEPYSGLHLLRRCYFDYFRTYYLCGILDTEKLYILKKGLLNKELSYLNEFHAYYEKFVYGHYLHYDVLFEIGVLETVPSRIQWDIVMSGQQGANEANDLISDKNCIMKLALEHYEKAYGYMDRIGDKTAYFVRCRQMEIKVAQGLYEEAEQFYKHFQAFAEREDSDYYQGCASFYSAKLNLIKRFDPKLIEINDSLEQEKIVKRHLDAAEKYFKAADPINPYVDVHIGLYRLILESISTDHSNEKRNFHSNNKSEFSSLSSVCQEYGYRREILLIERIMDKSKPLSFFDMSNIVKFYPFVAQ